MRQAEDSVRQAEDSVRQAKDRAVNAGREPALDSLLQ